MAAPAEVFMCGLLAGIGRLGLASIRPAAYSDLLAQYQAAGKEALLAAENMVFGMNHLELAAAMMEDWKIPRLFCQAVAMHERQPAPDSALSARQLQMAGVLRIAAAIAELCVAPEPMRERLASALPAMAEEMDIDCKDLMLILAVASHEWLEWSAMLGVAAHPLQLPPIERLIG